MSAPPASLTARGLLGPLVFIGVVAAAAARYVFARDIPPAQAAPAFAALLALLIPYIGFGFPGIASGLRRLAPAGWRGAAAATGVAVPAVLALDWGRGVETVGPAVGLIAYASLCAILFAWAARIGEPPNVADALAVLAVWVPVEIGLLQGLWRREGVDPSYLLGKTLCLSVLLAGCVAVRPVGGIGYRWRFRLEDAGTAAVATAAFLVVAVPVGLATGFVAFDPRAVSPEGLIFRILAIGLFVALPEEVLFRGVIFNLLQKGIVSRHGPWPALVISCLIFGLSHMNNFPYGDLRYALLATYAGACYAWCYLRTGNLLAGILTHTAVDLIHRLILITPAR